MLSGESIAEAVRVLLEHDERQNITAIGVNCVHPRHTLSLLESIRDCDISSRLLIAYPNLGEVRVSE
jgi:S-methylmethionine-dependent homocysteine/selenocysteine methylase